MTSGLCPYLRRIEITGPDYRNSSASARRLLRVSYVCTLDHRVPRASRRVCPRKAGRGETCPSLFEFE